ncbi:hypothetical protein MTY66_52080 [Mycolicibacterium sp. TY66]|nr:hypothetical protein MTY66_52080 [Mycolicibacterium sp. TY66]BCJ78775.1 hypothetical protein MTY81_01480 [Mycolicibacterium sp. TY81]
MREGGATGDYVRVEKDHVHISGMDARARAARLVTAVAQQSGQGLDLEAVFGEDELTSGIDCLRCWTVLAMTLARECRYWMDAAKVTPGGAN